MLIIVINLHPAIRNLIFKSEFSFIEVMKVITIIIILSMSINEE